MEEGDKKDYVGEIAVVTRNGKKRMSRKERREASKKRKTSSISDGNDAASTCEKDYTFSFTPIEVPLEPSREVVEDTEKDPTKRRSDKKASYDDEGGDGDAKGSLGKWFPNALLVKSPINYSNTGRLMLNSNILKKDDVHLENPSASLVLFYQYSSAASGKQWSQHQVKLLMTYLSDVAKRRNIGGRIRVATEGVNATVSAVDMPNVSAKETLRHFSLDLKNFDSKVFESTDFKYIDDMPPDRHFKELRIIPVQELVFYDIREDDAPFRHSEQGNVEPSGGIHLEAKEYHDMLKKDNTVVIDVRNHYESIIGRFDGQQKAGGATYLDPKMRKVRTST